MHPSLQKIRAMATTNTPDQMVGDFKNLYEKSGLVDAIPSWLLLQDRFKFSEADAGLGQYYVFGVTLAKEQGFTYAPSSGTGSGVVTLNASVAGYIGQAQIQGYAIYLRSRLSYDAAAKASKAGKKAFAQAYSAVLKNMKESHQFRLEVSLLYGQDGLGIVLTNTSGVLVFTAATWSVGIWASGMTGAVLEAWTANTPTATQHNTDLTVSSVSISGTSITVTGTNSAVAPGDHIYFKGSRTSTAYNEAPGLYRIMTTGTLYTTTTTIFNIDTALYDLWKSQYYAVNGNLSLTAIMQACATAIPFGLQKALLFIAPTKFAQLASDEAALRRYVQNTPETKRGVKGISFMLGSVDVEILPHPIIKQGHGMMFPEAHYQRVGATDVTMSLPGSGESLSVNVTDSTAIEFRSMSDQGGYVEVPAQCCLLDLIS
jgi:hypothetical protein